MGLEVALGAGLLAATGYQQYAARRDGKKAAEKQKDLARDNEAKLRTQQQQEEAARASEMLRRRRLAGQPYTGRDTILTGPFGLSGAPGPARRTAIGV